MSIHLHRKQLTILSITAIVFILFVLFTGKYKTNGRFGTTRYLYSKNKFRMFMQKNNEDEIKRLDKKWYLENCLQKKLSSMSLEYLSNYIERFRNSAHLTCNLIADIFESIFELEETYSDVVLSPEFEKKVLKWLDNNKQYLSQAHHQKIVKLYNKFLHEEMIFNPLRGKRPQVPNQVSDKNYTLNLLKESRQNCDFCDNNYEKNTASDPFGRLETTLSYSAANTFKYDKWHSLIVSRNHDPVFLTEAEVLDMFMLSLKWYLKVSEIDVRAVYPELLWDSMPKSGASQVHTHLQVSMGRMSYYGGMRRLLDASAHYQSTYQRNYLDDFILLHKALGLANRYNNTHLVVNLVPIKEQEVMIIGGNDFESYETTARLIHRVIRIFVEQMEQFSFSLVCYLPVYEGSSNKNDFKNFFNREENVEILEEPAEKLNNIFCRVVFRTPITNLRSDMNGLDLYTSSVLGIDRYKIATRLFLHLANFK